MKEKKLHLIWICPEFPYPPNTGGRIGIWKRIEYLSKKHDIYLFSVIDREEESACITEVHKYCVEVRQYKRNNLISMIPGLFVMPYACASRKVLQMKQDISKCLEDNRIDAVIVDFPQMILNIPKTEVPVILNQHNTEYMALKAMARSQNFFLKKVAYLEESLRLYQYEKKLYASRRFSLVTFVSIEDKQKFEKDFPGLSTLLVPVGSETMVESPKIIDSRNLIYVAKMDYPANEEAAEWFVKNIMPGILSEVPDAKLYLVGKNPTSRVKKLACSSVIVTGSVDSVEPYYSKSNLVVIPLLHGGGVKVKLLEAMGYGKLIITSEKGVEGTEFQEDQELLIARNEMEFITKCVKALSNPSDFEKIQSNALQCIKDVYSWKTIVFEFELQLMKVTKR